MDQIICTEFSYLHWVCLHLYWRHLVVSRNLSGYLFLINIWWYLHRFSYPKDPHLWRVQSWVCLGLVWASSRPQWPWLDWECCWPCLRTSLPISACGSWFWQDTNCRSHWHGGSRLPWLLSHSGFCHWHCFSHWLHSHFSGPSRASYPSWNWQWWTIIV